MKPNTKDRNTSTTTRPRPGYNTTGQQYQPHDILIPTNPPPDLPDLGSRLLDKLLARFNVLHAEALALNFQNYREYVTLRGQLEHIHQQFERAAAGGAARAGGGSDEN